jgi:UDP-3-O-[3-hydroxymyristoyl] glucosamine N-acyltransferase
MSGLTVSEIAAICRGQVEGDENRLITGASTVEDARESDLAFAANRKAIDAAKHSRAGCLLVPESFQESGAWSLIRVPDPRGAFARALAGIYPAKKRPASIHPTAIIADTSSIGEACHIGAYVTIGEHCAIGEHCSIADGCVIGSSVTIGEATTLHPRVTLYDRVRIGARAILHSGCVIGADGFGFTLAGDHYEKFPQVGAVEIGDYVELGANCCVDRAALGVTRIGNGTKLDNLVHVAHNCVIGKHVVIAAQTGFSGSVTVGDYAVIGGQAGIGEKAVIDAKAVIGGKAGILTSKHVEAGEPMWGIPARPLRQHLKGLAHVNKLSQYRNELLDLKRRLEQLESA